MSVYALALLIGVVAGLRAMTAPAVVSWAAYLCRMHLEGTWLAFLGYAWTPYILSALALAELVTDQLPDAEPQGANAVWRADCYRSIVRHRLRGVRRDMDGGLVAGVIGAIAGTLGGYEFRKRLVAATGGKDLPIALLEDAIAIGGAILIVTSFS
jgi:uncharacterized membrane protein